MIRLLLLLGLAIGLAVPAAAVGGGAPPGATAQCRDGTYSFSQHHSGTCSHHGGVAVWLDGSSSSPSAPTSSSPATTNGGGSCGVERWTVKTLQDRPQLLPTRKVTLTYLITRPAPPSLPTTRLRFERHVFQVRAAVILVRHEHDSDLHLVLSDGNHTMIAESPLASCAPGATPTRRSQMADARTKVRLCSKALVTGVAFFDFEHGQTGVAPNAIELHPVLGFRCLA
jgi:Protein of unknown function (DUF3761)